MSTYGDEFHGKVVQASESVKCKAFGVGAKVAAPHEPEQAFTVAATAPTAAFVVPAAAGTLADLAAASTAIDATRAVLRGVVEELHKTGVLA